MSKKPVVLCILDGWGLGDGGEFDAIASAKTPNFDSFMQDYPNTTLTTFGGQVGLPEGQMGNSEVGHMNIGAGRVVMQFLPRINKAFKENQVKDLDAIKALIHQLQDSGKSVHIMGLMSDGGVHAHMDHILGLAEIFGNSEIPTHIHAFTDGRDCAPQSSSGYIEICLNTISGYSTVKLSTITGRYFAMDRDNRWERVEKAYNAVINGQGVQATDAVSAIGESYKAGVYDEFIEPIIMDNYDGLKEGDAIIFANFRNDRAREILQPMLLDQFDGFSRQGSKPQISKALAMVEYSDELNAHMNVLFKPLVHKNILGEVVAKAGMTQLRAAETEKYPHVTFFFNCGREVPFEGEDRLLVNSPKVATYDLQPEMSAPELSEKLLKKIDSDQYDMVIVNFANTDMVGHTGSIDAARKAAEAVDEAIGELKDLVLEKDGTLLVTADHGNADIMYDPKTKGPHTAHTLNPVPFIVIGGGNVSLRKGKLADIAPTMLHYLGINKPDDMDGKSLIL